MQSLHDLIISERLFDVLFFFLLSHEYKKFMHISIISINDCDGEVKRI